MSVPVDALLMRVGQLPFSNGCPWGYNPHMIIDFHAHIFPDNVCSDRTRYLELDATFEHLYSDPKARLSSAELLVERMDRDGVDISVTLGMGWQVHEFAVEANDYILESARVFPDRLVPFCTVNPALGDIAVKEVERCAELGARGIGELHSYAQGYRLDDERVMRPFMEAAIALGLIVLTHSSEPVGHVYSGKGTVTPDELYPFIETYPEAKIVCAHWGGGLPFYALMPEVSEAMQNVYFDSAASPFLYIPDVFANAINMVGQDKVLFGTDYPLLSHKRLLAQVESQNLDVTTKDAVLGGNARRLLGI